MVLSLVVMRSTSRKGGLSDVSYWWISVRVAHKDPVDLPSEQPEEPILTILDNSIGVKIWIDDWVVIAVEAKEADPALPRALAGGLSGAASVRLRITRLPRCVADRNLPIFSFSVFGLHTVAVLVPHSLISCVLIPLPCVAIHIKIAYKLHFGAPTPRPGTFCLHEHIA